MTELYKWEIDGRDVFIDRLGAYGIETMTREEAESRLNEYETLKAATERLSAEDARLWADRIEQYFRGAQIVDAFRAYADILEGKSD